jgi:hypothetical protein
MRRYNWFDALGHYFGYVDEHGIFFDKDGHPWARVDAECRVVDLDGCDLGHIDAQGNFFGRHAHWRGYLRDWPDRPCRSEPPPASVSIGARPPVR